jgi:flagellar protein FliO/FliZ
MKAGDRRQAMTERKSRGTGNGRAARTSCVITLSLYHLITSTASAAEKAFAAPHVADHVPASNAGSLAQVTLSLLVVLAAVFAAAWVVRRLRGVGKFGSNAIEIIADAPLGTKERAVLIQVGNQQLLLGVAPGQIRTLHVLPEPVVVNSAPRSADPNAAQRPDFKAILKRSLGL